MSERAPYSRVYWSIQHDEKFDGIREDMRLIGSWLTLLVIADQTWPAPAYPPPIVPKSALKALAEAGLIDLLSGGRFRIHGLDNEREKRKTLATTRGPSGDRPVPVRGPNGDLDKEEDEKSTSRDTARDPADIYWQLTGKYPTEKALSWVDSLTSQYGAESVIVALVKAQRSDPSVSTIIGRTRDILAADARKLDLREREAEQARLAEKRQQPRVEEPWRAEYREAIRKQYEGLDAA